MPSFAKAKASLPVAKTRDRCYSAFNLKTCMADLTLAPRELVQYRIFQVGRALFTTAQFVEFSDFAKGDGGEFFGPIIQKIHMVDYRGRDLWSQVSSRWSVFW